MLEKAYRLGSTQSQVLNGVIELGLPPRSIGHGFLKQSRESERLSHKRSEPGKMRFERQYIANTGIQTFRGKSISRASDVSRHYQLSVDLPRGSTNKADDLRYSLEVQVEANEQLMVESRGMMM